MGPLIVLTGDEGGDDQRQDHELEEPHEELARVGDVRDGQGVELGRPEGEAEDDAEADPGEGDDEEEVLPDPGPHRVLGHLQDLRLHLELAGLWKKKNIGDVKLQNFKNFVIATLCIFLKTKIFWLCRVSFSAQKSSPTSSAIQRRVRQLSRGLISSLISVQLTNHPT